MVRTGGEVSGGVRRWSGGVAEWWSSFSRPSRPRSTELIRSSDLDTSMGAIMEYLVRIITHFPSLLTGT